MAGSQPRGPGPPNQNMSLSSRWLSFKLSMDVVSKVSSIFMIAVIKKKTP